MAVLTSGQVNVHLICSYLIKPLSLEEGKWMQLWEVHGWNSKCSCVYVGSPTCWIFPCLSYVDLWLWTLSDASNNVFLSLSISTSVLDLICITISLILILMLILWSSAYVKPLWWRCFSYICLCLNKCSGDCSPMSRTGHVWRATAWNPSLPHPPLYPPKNEGRDFWMAIICWALSLLSCLIPWGMWCPFL